MFSSMVFSDTSLWGGGGGNEGMTQGKDVTKGGGERGGREGGRYL